MQAGAANTVVLGLGNILHSDDGVGPQAIDRLRAEVALPTGVALVEGGTLGLELLTYLWDCSHLIIIDAVDVGEKPGTVIRLTGQDLNTLPGNSSVHQLGVADLLAALRVLDAQQPTVVLLGVQPASTEWGLDLSPAVATAMDSLVKSVVKELQSLALSAEITIAAQRANYVS
jgi:hydrogenase maturation protease